MENEQLGAAETILQTLLTYSDHMVHNRPGMVVEDTSTVTGVRWMPVSHRVDNGQKVVLHQRKVGAQTVPTRVGTMQDDGRVMDGDRIIGTYQPAGLFPQVAAWMYGQVAEVWKLDNEFGARWASYAFAQEHRDLKVVLAAFMLVQARKGDPVREGTKVLFVDEDFRDVGEAMVLLVRKDKRDLNPKLLIRVQELLSLPAVAQINRELGFTRSARTPFLGRWGKAVNKWLRYREDNPKMLEGLVKAGFRTTVMSLARKSRYKPQTGRFFEVLRWKQAQSQQGHRDVAVGQKVAAAETWEGLSEAQICQRVVRDRPNYKRLVGMLPSAVGLTRAIVAAAMEAGSMSDKDLIILTPTLEGLGLLEVSEVRERWTQAVQTAEDVRAANVAKRVRNKDTVKLLEDAADDALKRAVEDVARKLRIYFIVDISGSMTGAIEEAKSYISKFLQAFPQDRLHVSVFNTRGRELKIRHASKIGVWQAFKGITAGGATDYGAGVEVLSKYTPAADEDSLFIFVGDEKASIFVREIEQSKLRPMAFGFVKVTSRWGCDGTAVRETARHLGIPCFMIDVDTFEDPYAIPRTVRQMVASTPVSKDSVSGRKSLLDEIQDTEILMKPAWAA